MEPALAVARLPEGGEKRALLAQDLLRDQLADAQHLVAVVGIRDHVAVLAEDVEDGEGVGREAADTAGLLVVIEARLALEPLVAVGTRRRPMDAIGRASGRERGGPYE